MNRYEKEFWGESHFIPNAGFTIGTYDENGKLNALNAAWGGISEETQISICVDAGHKTQKMLLKQVHLL